MSLTMSEYDPVSAPPKGNLVLALSDAFCTYRPQRRTAADGLLGRHTASDVGGSDANHHRRATAGRASKGRDPWKRVGAQSVDQCHEIWRRVEYKVAKSVH